MSIKKFKKLSLVKQSDNFSEAIKIVESPLVVPKDNEILVRNIFVGINQTDLLLKPGRDGSKRQLPFDVGIDV